jgi:hypothetical protein
MMTASLAIGVSLVFAGATGVLLAGYMWFLKTSLR